MADYEQIDPTQRKSVESEIKNTRNSFYKFSKNYNPAAGGVVQTNMTGVSVYEKDDPLRGAANPYTSNRGMDRVGLQS